MNSKPRGLAGAGLIVTLAQTAVTEIHRIDTSPSHQAAEAAASSEPGLGPGPPLGYHGLSLQKKLYLTKTLQSARFSSIIREAN